MTNTKLIAYPDLFWVKEDLTKVLHLGAQDQTQGSRINYSTTLLLRHIPGLYNAFQGTQLKIKKEKENWTLRIALAFAHSC